MKQIYQQATEVIIWLGPSNEGTEIGLEIIKEVAKRKRHSFASRTFAMFAGTDREMIRYSGYDEKLPGMPPRNSNKWRYVGDILQRPWFSRLWVIQEVFAARKSIMRIGLHTIDVLTMLAAFHDLATQITYANIFTHAEAIPGRLYGVYLFRFLAGPQIKIEWLSDVLFHTRNFKYTDPRDRIIASLGCYPNPDEDKPDELIDYEADWRQLFLRVAKGPFDGASEIDPGTSVVSSRLASRLGASSRLTTHILAVSCSRAAHA
jgi:Heterokaryon incompatibility protein (HET)